MGIMLGYALATLMSSFTECPLYECWRWPFFIQAILMTPITLMCYFVPGQHIDARKNRENVLEYANETEVSFFFFFFFFSFVSCVFLSAHQLILSLFFFRAMPV
jgi:MFS family permease